MLQFGSPLVLLPVFLSAPPVAQGVQEEAPPSVASYAAIEASYYGRVLLDRDATWRYLPGTENPTEKYEWTARAYDDAAWSEGPGPFGFGDASPFEGVAFGTVVPKAPSLYLRRTLRLGDRTPYARIVLDLPVDDGFVFFVNGREEDRQHAGNLESYNAFDTSASAEREVETPPTPRVDLTPVLKDGDNVLAIHVLTSDVDRDTLGVHPRVRVVYEQTEELDRAHRDEMLALLALDSGGDLEARGAFVRATYHLRRGEHAEAAKAFAEAAELDPESALPWERLADCHRALGALADLEAGMIERLRAGGETPAMLEVLTSVALDELGRSSSDLAAAAQRAVDRALPETGAFADALHAAATIEASGVLSVDCGAAADRFHRMGHAETRDGEGALATVRVATRELDRLEPLYRVPVPPGAYRVTLTFAPSAVGEALTDVALAGAIVARDHDPADAATLAFPLRVRSGYLDVDLYQRAESVPALAALAIEVLDADAFASLAGEWSERASASPAALVQRAEALLLGDPEAGAADALAPLEKAEALPGFVPAHAAILEEVRDALLPDVPTISTAEFFAQRGEGVEAILASAPESEGSIYLAGRFHELAGNIDEAIGAFEVLAFGDGTDPRPRIRMAECLAKSALGEEAAALLEEGLAFGLDPTPELFQLWSSLRLEAGDDPWDVARALREMGAPPRMVVLPSSDLAPRPYKISTLWEPPANAWSRLSYDDSWFADGYGGFGAGQTKGGHPRALWNTERVFGRQHFELFSPTLLYPYFDIQASDAGEGYLNGTQVARVLVEVDGYVLMPIRKSPFVAGENMLGVVGFNSRDGASVDVGIVQPLDVLWHVLDQLDEHGALRINCGGGELVTSDGKYWNADTAPSWHGWGQPRSAPELEIEGTDDDELYRTNTWFYEDTDGTWYQVPLPNGTYEVTLHFAEIEADPDPSPRTFSLRVQTEKLLDETDLVAEVGFATATTRTATVSVIDGWLDIVPSDELSESFVSAIEIVAK